MHANIGIKKGEKEEDEFEIMMGQVNDQIGTCKGHTCGEREIDLPS